MAVLPGRTRAGRALLAAALAALVAGTAAASTGRVERLGRGADEVWILRPAGRPTNVVVFGHGWGTPFPGGFGGWIAHLRARGSIVVYPRYRVSAGEPVAAALAAFETGVRLAFGRLGRVRLPVIAVGKSFGGSAVFDYASAAPGWGLPEPAVVFSVFPAIPVGGPPARPLARGTFVEILVGDADTTAGSVGADQLWRWLGAHPRAEKRYVVVRSQPGFVANHDSAQRTDRIARADFWAPLDRLIARTVAGRP